MRASRLVPTIALPTIASLAVVAVSPSASAVSGAGSSRTLAVSAVQRLAESDPYLVQHTVANETGSVLAHATDTMGRKVQLSKAGVVSFTTPSGAVVDITPDIDGLQMTPQLEQNVFVYTGTRGVSATVAINSSGAQIFCVFENDQAPEACKFKVNTPQGYSLTVNPDGSAAVLNGENASVLNVGVPFAYDKKGAKVNTAYSVEGNTLTQVVRHRIVSATYPVVADPGIDWGRLGTFTACFVGAGGAIGIIIVIGMIGGTSAIITAARYGRLPAGTPWWAYGAMPILRRCAWAITG